MTNSEHLYNREIINNPMSETKYYIVNEYSREKPLVELIEMWESYTGWYWYITEIEKEGYEGIIEIDANGKEITEFGHAAFGYVCGLENEWGSIWMPDLERLTRAKDPEQMAWKVNKENWIGNSRVLRFETEEEFNSKVEELRKKYDERFGEDE